MVSPTRFYGLAVERLARIIDQSPAAGPDGSDNLDEYVGLGPEDPQSYHYFMQQSLFQDINILPQSTHIPDGLADDLDVFCEQYEQRIRDLGGIDLQILEEVEESQHLLETGHLAALGIRRRDRSDGLGR